MQTVETLFQTQEETLTVEKTASSVALLIPEYTVSALATALKRTVEENYAQVRVRGEISGAKQHASGHFYFSLKDVEAVIDAVCWRPVVGKLGFKLEDGMDVICLGRVTTYPGRSKYQIVIEHVELAGQGALLKLLEERKQRLQAEGLFDASRKRPIPFLPKVIGVVTSPTGAVIRDILHRLRDRFPCHVLLWPVTVQGETAAAQVAAAVRGFNKIGGQTVPCPDVLIVARGGGSLEDLWPFNEEIVVRAVAESAIPVISAVGHETDTTLIDYASDLRAPTPTAAAEKAVPVRTQLIAQIQDINQRLTQATLKFIEHRWVVMNHVAQRLPNLPNVVNERVQKVDDWGERLQRAIHFRFTQWQAIVAQRGGALRHPTSIVETWNLNLQHLTHRLKAVAIQVQKLKTQELQQLSAMLSSLAPDRVLERGYAIVKNAQTGLPVIKAAGTHPAEVMHVHFQDGMVAMVVDGNSVVASTVPVKPSDPSEQKATPKLNQGSLW